MIDGVPKSLYFTDRRDISRRIILPENRLDRQYLIIYPNSTGSGYSQLDYAHMQPWLLPHLSSDELKGIIAHLNSIHGHCLGEQRRYENNTRYGNTWKITLSACILFSVLASSIFVYENYYNSGTRYKRQLRISAICAVMAALLCTVILVLLSLSPFPPLITHQQLLDRSMREHIDRLNTLLSPKGLTLLGGKKMIWMELWKSQHVNEHMHRPVISLIGREPITDYDEQMLNTILEHRQVNLERVYKRKSNVKYERLSYLQKTYENTIAKRCMDIPSYNNPQMDSPPVKTIT